MKTKKFKKKSIKIVFTSGPNSKPFLCRNKTKLLPNAYPEVQELNYVTHFGKDINAQYIFKRKWIGLREN